MFLPRSLEEAPTTADHHITWPVVALTSFIKILQIQSTLSVQTWTVVFFCTNNESVCVCVINISDRLIFPLLSSWFWTNSTVGSDSWRAAAGREEVWSKELLLIRDWMSFRWIETGNTVLWLDRSVTDSLHLHSCLSRSLRTGDRMMSVIYSFTRRPIRHSGWDLIWSHDADCFQSLFSQ